jgi:hypothetical protein
VINSGIYEKNENKKNSHHSSLLTKSPNILPIDICSPSVFKAMINSLDQTDVHADL